MNILVIDVGTSSMRGVVFTHEGQELFCEQVPYRPLYLGNGWVEQPPADWESALCTVLSAAAGASQAGGWPLEGIALTSQRSSVIPVDRDIRPLCRAIMWQDKRVEALCREREPENGWVFQRCGSRVNPVFSGAKMAWIRQERPEIYQKTYKFLVVPDYLLYRLTGRLATDHTYGSRSLLMGLKTRQWDRDLLALFGVEESKLCPLVEPGSLCGGLTEEMSAATGCPQGIPVITAGGDQQCGAVGQGVVKAGALSITAGTGGYLIAGAEEVPQGLGQDVLCNCSAIRGQYILESSVLACCSAFDWFRREFYGPGCTPAQLDAEAAQSPPGANGCICLPYFQGRSTPDWNTAATGVFHNVGLHTRRQDMLRALLEGIALELGRGVQAMGAYVPLGEIYINGGLTNSGPFNQMQSDVYGLRVLRRGKADATARGALIIAAHALGAYPSVESAYREISKNDAVQVYEPQEENTAAYRLLREQADALYRRVWPLGGDREA